MIKNKPLKIDDQLIVNWDTCEICLGCFKEGDIVYTNELKHYHEMCYLTERGQDEKGTNKV